MAKAMNFPERLRIHIFSKNVKKNNEMKKLKNFND